MWKFIKHVLATFTGLVLFCFVSLILLIIILSLSDNKPTIPANAVLRLNLNKQLVEKTYDDWSGLNKLIRGQDKIGLLNLKKAIQQAKQDPNIKGIYLETGFIQAGFSSLQEIRDALIDFQTSGKFVIAYSEVYTERGYYLASMADRIYLNPAGILEFNGLSAEMTYFKGTLDKLHIQHEIFRVGEYKDYIEQFTLDKMSPASRFHITFLLNALYANYLKHISDSRKVNISTLNTIADSLLVSSPEEAKTHHLITDIGYEDQVHDYLLEKLKLDKTKKVAFVNLEAYQKNLKEEDEKESKIAVIIAQGSINSGNDEDPETISSEVIVKELRKARRDPSVKSVVLRINSPGGSSLASEVIWREVVLTNEVKPVIASMSDVVASGGYYIAAGCKKIVAQPTTVTGSIGIFLPLFNIENFLKDKLGITTDRVKTNTYSDLPTITRALSAYEKKIIQKNVEEGYHLFLQRVADGRHLSIEDVKKVAGGRVWPGDEAKKVGLVDELGGFDQAINLAAHEAKLKKGDYQLEFITSKKSWVERLFSSFSEEMSERAIKNEAGDLYYYIHQLKELKSWNGIQARMPFTLDIH